MSAIEIMMEEHKNILTFLKIVRRVCYRAYDYKELDYESIEDIIYFIKNYADGLHHKKEETMLFNKMVEHIGPLSEKAITCGMLVEHDMARLYVKGLEESVHKYKEGDKEAVIDIIANAISYTHLLERHIDKEDNVIYKFGQRKLSEEILKDINIQCTDFEDKNVSLRNDSLNILKGLGKKYL